MESNASLLPTEIDTYVYHPLAEGHMRLVKFFCDTTDAPLRCRIFTSRLEHALLLPFEALSYVWGHQEPLYDLLCNDVKTGVLRIGPNLHNALLHLRFLPSMNIHPRLLWIDRICINQDDAKERASQVLLMGSIYRGCRQTLVWLGREDPNTKEAFECARYIHENNLGSRETPWETLAQFRSPAVSFASLSDSLIYLAKLTRRPWFERAWTFQEVVLPSTVSLVCGNTSMPMEYLETCIEPAVSQASALFSGEAHLIFATRKVKDTFSEDSGRLPADDLERLLAFRRGVKMSDPRDFIFSLLGLFSPSVSLSLSPDYSISVKDLFTAVANHIMRVSGELRILCSVESPKHFEGEACPSWVPDWRASEGSLQNNLHDRNPRSGYRATRQSILEHDPSKDVNELRLYGIPIGVVNQAGRYNSFHSISDFNLGSRYNHTYQPITTALRQAQTLDFDVGVEDEVINIEHSQRRSLAAFYDLPMGPYMRRRKCSQCPIAHTMPILSIGKAKQYPELASIVRLCSKTVRSRAFFTTDSRYLGFGPKCTVAGDQIFLLIGSDVPFILRQAGEKYELVGACYVHGIMYGEGLHQSFNINTQFYPGSIPGGEWNFSDAKVPPATWMTVAEDIDGSHIDARMFHGLTPTISNAVPEKSTTSVTRRYLLCEEERDPVLIEAKRVILK